jgi:lipopolysaccharide export LptBFGC system permease protein LptF
MFLPTIIKRRQNDQGKWIVLGKISADSATYNDDEKRWYLENGIYTKIAVSSGVADFDQQIPTKVEYYDSSLDPIEIPIRKQEGYKSLLSSHQLAVLAESGASIKDQAELHSQKHFRFTDPIINIIMLLIALPVLVCRDPKNMKSAIIISFTVTTACFIVTFGCKMFAGEIFFNQIRPALWAWLPIVIFMPIAFVEIDSMKT